MADVEGRVCSLRPTGRFSGYVQPLQVHRQRTRYRIQPRLLWSKVLWLQYGPVHESGLERTGRAGSLCEAGQPAESKLVQLCAEQPVANVRSGWAFVLQG